MAVISIMVVDDHAILRDGICSLVGNQPDMKMLGEAENGEEAISTYEALKPDVLLMDLQMPGIGGLEAMSRILSKHPKARIIVLTTYSGDVQAARAVRAGAAGYLLKSGLRRELLDTIRRVHAGLRYIPAEIAQEIALHAGDDALSSRELEVLRLVGNGLSNKLIGRELSIAEDTVKAHLKSIFLKLAVADRTQAVLTAMRRGII